jgi:hypothetical protein
MEQQIQDTFVVVPLHFLRKSDKSFRSQKCVQNAGACVEN